MPWYWDSEGPGSATTVVDSKGSGNWAVGTWYLGSEECVVLGQ